MERRWGAMLQQGAFPSHPPLLQGDKPMLHIAWMTELGHWARVSPARAPHPVTTEKAVQTVDFQLLSDAGSSHQHPSALHSWLARSPGTTRRSDPAAVTPLLCTMAGGNVTSQNKQEAGFKDLGVFKSLRDFSKNNILALHSVYGVWLLFLISKTKQKKPKTK